MIRSLPVVLAFALSACASSAVDPEAPVEPLGDFKLGFVEVVAPNLQKLLVSREASEDEWIAEVDRAMEARFGRFGGDRFYHFGISVEAYSLPPPVVPGKSALAIRVTVWDDAAQGKLNDEPELINVIKVFESRIAGSREQSMTALADDAALQAENWLRTQMAEAGWFLSDDADADDVGDDAETAVPEG